MPWSLGGRVMYRCPEYGRQTTHQVLSTVVHIDNEMLSGL